VFIYTKTPSWQKEWKKSFEDLHREAPTSGWIWFEREESTAWTWSLHENTPIEGSGKERSLERPLDRAAVHFLYHQQALSEFNSNSHTKTQRVGILNGGGHCTFRLCEGLDLCCHCRRSSTCLYICCQILKWSKDEELYWHTCGAGTVSVGRDRRSVQLFPRSSSTGVLQCWCW